MKIINSKSTLKMNNNIYKTFNFNKYKDLKKEDEYFAYSPRKTKNSNNNNLKNLYTKDNIYSKNNSKFLYDDKGLYNNFYYYNTQSNSYQKNRNNNRNSLGDSNRLNLFNDCNNINRKGSLFSPDFPNKKYGNNLFTYSNRNSNEINLRISNHYISTDKNRPKSGLKKKITNTKYLIKKLEQKRNKEFLDNIIYRNNNKDNYNNKIYELFKKTEYF